VFAEVVSDRGQGPALVYVPGIDGSGQLLLGTAPRLEERFRLIRLRYRTSANPAHRSYAHLAASAIEAVSLRGVERMALLAESFGGGVALRAAIDFPTEVTALALVNTFAHYRRRSRLAVSRVALRCTPAWAIAAGRRVVAPRILFGGPADRAAIAEFLGDGKRAASARPGAGPRVRGDGDSAARRSSDAAAVVWGLDEGYHARLRMIQDLDLRRDLGRVTQPVAIFASGKDRVVESIRQAREMASALPDAEVEILAGRGHVVLPVREVDWPAHLDRLLARAAGRAASH
jgi:pimeloyl-ACP methyl ester carboxylesterase